MKIMTKTVFAAVLATTTLMNALSAEAKAGGKTLWFEGYGLYGATPFSGAWNTDPIDNAANPATPNTTVKTYVKGESFTGFGGGLNVGYQFVQGLSGVLGLQMAYQSATTREKRPAAGGLGFDVERTTKTSYTATTFNLGIRPETTIGAISIYGGGGLLFLMPMTITADEQTPGELNAGARTSRLTSSKYNLGLGAYGEMGAKYHIGAIAIGLGLRVNIVSASNNGKTTVQEDLRVDGTTRTTTTTHKDSFSNLEATAVTVGNATAQIAQPVSSLITNWQILLSATYALNL